MTAEELNRLADLFVSCGYIDINDWAVEDKEWFNEIIDALRFKASKMVNK